MPKRMAHCCRYGTGFFHGLALSRGTWAKACRNNAAIPLLLIGPKEKKCGTKSVV